MPQGFRFVWTDDDIPTGGTAAVFDDRSVIVALLHRPSFEDDPEGFMASLESHIRGEVDARTLILRELRLAG